LSHSPERSEKICLNCNAPVYGKYCHQCGQENREPKESAWQLIKHFFEDITHFDGKFFTTLKILISKPGFLSKEYLLGRRARYLSPVRMYVFTSALFFLIFFSLYSVKLSDDDKERINAANPVVADSIDRRVDSMLKAKGIDTDEDDSSGISELKNETDTLVAARRGPKWNFNLGGSEYASKKAYDSTQRQLPPGEKDGWIKQKLVYRSIDLGHKYRDNKSQLISDLGNAFLHQLPYLLFVSLPLYALFLKLFYIRRKKFYYIDHVIFLLHLYIFTFIFMLVYIGINRLENVTDNWILLLYIPLIPFGIYYTLKAMRNFYSQGWGKTILKFLLLNLLALFSLILLFTIFGLITILIV
jgi:hypothetical protein